MVKSFNKFGVILGLDNLTLVIDHKPLLAILDNKQNLEYIPNPRLMNVKLKSMMCTGSRLNSSLAKTTSSQTPSLLDRPHLSAILITTQC